MHEMMKQIQVLSTILGNLCIILRGLLQFTPAVTSRAGWSHLKGVLLTYHLSTIRAHNQSDLGLKNFLFPSGIWISLSHKLKTVTPAHLKGPFL